MRSRKDGRRKRFKRQGGCLVRGVPPVCAGGVCLDRAETGHEPGVQHPFSRFRRRKGACPRPGRRRRNASDGQVEQRGHFRTHGLIREAVHGGVRQFRHTVRALSGRPLCRELSGPGLTAIARATGRRGGEALSASAARPASVLRSVMSGEVIPAVRILLHTTCIYLIGMSDFFIGLTATPHFIPYRQRNPNRYA